MALQGSCHCGKTRFEVDEAPAFVMACTCSYCTKVGGQWGYYAPEQFRLLTPPEDSAVYKFGSHVVEHHHCADCGCATFGVSPEFVDFKPHPTKKKVGVNARLFDDFDLDAVEHRVIDGKNLW